MAGTAAGAAKARALRAARTTTEASSPASVVEPADQGTTDQPRHFWYVVGRKPLRHGARTYQVGEKFPHADQITRLEAWVRSGWLVPMS